MRNVRSVENNSDGGARNLLTDDAIIQKVLTAVIIVTIRRRGNDMSVMIDLFLIFLLAVGVGGVYYNGQQMKRNGGDFAMINSFGLCVSLALTMFAVIELILIYLSGGF